MNDIRNRNERPVPQIRQYWRVMSFYERCEQVVVFLLSAVIFMIIAVALWRLLHDVFFQLVPGLLGPLEYQAFQVVFGMVMTLLIALEFNHSIINVLYRRNHIIRVKTVILITQLALARKLIILDLETASAMQVFALGFAILVLAITHWLLRERDLAEGVDEDFFVTGKNKRVKQET